MTPESGLGLAHIQLYLGFQMTADSEDKKLIVSPLFGWAGPDQCKSLYHMTSFGWPVA